MTGRKVQTTLFMLIVLLFPLTVSAQLTERVMLDFKDEPVYTTKSSSIIINLKQELRKQYPHLVPDERQLQKVILTAKSKFGKGTVQLQVNRVEHNHQTIPGSEYQFTNPARHTFAKTHLTNRADSSKGVWRLIFSGNFVVRKATLVMVPYQQAPYYSDTTSSKTTITYRPANTGIKVTSKKQSRFYLPALSWGVVGEIDKQCGSRESFPSDGWHNPSTVCREQSMATFHVGHPPRKLFIRPDVRSFTYHNPQQQIQTITVSVTLDNRNTKNPGNGAVTVGMDIAGRSYTKEVQLKLDRNGSGSLQQVRFDINREISPAAMTNSKIWLKPSPASGDFTVRKFSVSATA